jgi:fatty-acyl-CoA synthase
LPSIAPTPKSGSLETRVLDTIRLLLQELGSRRALQSLSLQASLERDLGLGSLELVELLDRLEKEFSRKLPDEVLTQAETPADLVKALGAAPNESCAKPQPSTLLGPVGHSTPSAVGRDARGLLKFPSFKSLNDALEFYAERDPAKAHVHLYGEDQRPHLITYGQLRAGACAVASGLTARGLGHGETVSLMLPTGEDFFFAFFGVLLAGGVPVPIYPPFKASRLEEYAQRQSRILQNAGARFLITFRQAEKLARLLKPGIPALRGVLTISELVEKMVDRQGVPATAASRGDQVALIQYTSGSTGDPKGVVLTHSNLLANIQAIGTGLDLRAGDFGVSWLPLYHDMGLIGSWLTALCFGVPTAILSPLAFLSRPERWLWAIHEHRGTVSAAPNFAYELCARKIDERAIEGLDLSCWRVALNGAEPISPDTLERFARRFAPYGFRAEAFLPSYGLAESSVALTFPPLDRKPRVDRIGRKRFESTGAALPCSQSDASSLRFVSEGKALPGHKVRVVDDDLREAGERVQGHIQFRGPSTMQGYFKNPAATAAVISKDGWIDTGDLGYLADGELFVTARIKDVIIMGGRNLYPQEVEEVVGDVQGVRRGCVAAFGISDQRLGTEKLVVIAETRETDRSLQDEIEARILSHVDAHLGLPPDVVRLVAPQTVPKTSSGKIRRDACKQMYLREQLATKPLPAWIQVLRLALGNARNRTGHAVSRSVQAIYGLYSWLVLAVVMLPGWILVMALPSDRNGYTARRTFGFLCRAALLLAGLKPRISGGEILAGALRHAQAGQPLIVVSNHASYLDVLVVAAVSPAPICFVSKSEASAWPVVGTFIRKCRYLTVSRRDALQAAADSQGIANRLESGETVHVFPEGTFTPHNGLRPFQMGAFKSAVESGCPVLPVTLVGTRNVLRDGSWLPRFHKVRVVASPILRPEGRSWSDMVRLRDSIRSEILKHCGEGAFDSLLAGVPRPEPGA